jgi:hypothetical protein
MLYVMVGSLVLAVLGVAWAITMYYKLWQWARQCQHARIVVAWKGKVQLNAPILEWMLWANLLDQDKDANGRVVYMNGGTRVAIIKRSFVAKGPMREFIAWLRTRSMRQAMPTASGEQGKWTAQDETVKQ